MRSAEARFSASIMSSNSIKCRSTGVQVGCTAKTSAPRTFSRICRRISPSEKGSTSAAPSVQPSEAQILPANAGLALPVKIFICSNLILRTGLGAAMFDFQATLPTAAARAPGSGCRSPSQRDAPGS